MQFTLSRLLASTAIVAFGVAGAVLPWRIELRTSKELPEIVLVMIVAHFLATLVIIGCGIGVLFKRATLGAYLGFFATVMLAVAHGLWPK